MAVIDGNLKVIGALNADGTIVASSGSFSSINAIQNISAGAASQNSGSIILSNSNGISFGLNAGTLTAQHNAITTAMLSNAATISDIRVSGGTTSNLLSAITFADGNGISFGLNAGTLTAQHNAITTAMLSNAATISDILVSGGTTSNLLSAITFADGNGIFFGLDASTMTARQKFQSAWNNYDDNVNSIAALTSQSVSLCMSFHLPFPISASYIRLPMVLTTGSTTIPTLASNTATASNNIGTTFNAVIYSIGTGANSLSLQYVASGAAFFTWSQRISITSTTRASYSQGFSGELEGLAAPGTSLSTQYSLSQTNYAFSTTWLTAFTGTRFLDIPLASSLSAGPYWLILGYSTSSASGGAVAAGMTNARLVLSANYIRTMTAAASLVAPLGNAVAGSTGGHMGAASFSTAGGGTTNSIPFANLTNNTQYIPWQFARVSND